jgi:pyruvate dehydrogenase E2 component (dihydrolipoyllysine-residue acetyltransferase)
MREVFRLPDVGEGIAQAEIVEYLVKVGDEVKADQIIVRVETDKAVVELPTPFAGKVVEIPHNPGDTVSVGDPLLIVETEATTAATGPREEKPSPAPSEPSPQPEPAAEKPLSVVPSRPAAGASAAAAAIAPSPQRRVLATPHTRRLARELGVDINTVTASGPHGRVTDDDIRQAVSATEPPAPKAPTAAAVQAPATAGFDFEKYGPTCREPLK